MKILISKKTKIYVVAPANVATGGTEAMHQLAYDLRELYEVDTVVVYYASSTDKNPIPQAYAHYNLGFSYQVEDNENNVLIIPETYATKFDGLQHIQKVIWWLSVDNYYISYDYFLHSNIQEKILRTLWKFGSQHFLFFNKDLQKIKWHLAQSQYAFEHLQKNGIGDAHYLLEHIGQEFLHYTVDTAKKEDIVAYNPKKGFAFTKRIIDASPNITFIPIIHMSRDQVVELLKKAKVYIDFGNHPGRDRIPREACILGCCVFTGKRGSAKFFNDVPIPDDCKFSETRCAIPRIREKIINCFRNYESETKKFDGYREKIKREREVYLSNIRDIFSFDPQA